VEVAKHQARGCNGSPIAASCSFSSGVYASVVKPVRWEPFGINNHLVAHRLKEHHMSIGTILLIILVLLLIGALPTWGYSGGWGYGPSGILGIVLVVVLVLVLLGRF
jgi:hypothetical protein